MLNSDLDYTERLLELNLLPLSLSVEIHDLLLFSSLVKSKSDMSIIVQTFNDEKIYQHNSEEQEIFRRNKFLYIVIKYYEKYERNKKIFQPTFLE